MIYILPPLLVSSRIFARKVSQFHNAKNFHLHSCYEAIDIFKKLYIL